MIFSAIELKGFNNVNKIKRFNYMKTLTGQIKPFTSYIPTVKIYFWNLFLVDYWKHYIWKCIVLSISVTPLYLITLRNSWRTAVCSLKWKWTGCTWQKRKQGNSSLSCWVKSYVESWEASIWYIKTLKIAWPY